MTPTTPTNFSGLCVSDFNIDNLAGYLNNDGEAPEVSVSTAPYGQVYQMLVETNEIWQQDHDFVLVWTQPQGVIASFNQVLNYLPVEENELLEQVDEYAAMLSQVSQRVHAVFVPTWVWPSADRGMGMLNMREGLGRTRLLMSINLRLAERLRERSNVYLLDAQRWVTQAGRQAYNPKYWYMAKVAFGNPVFKEAVRDIKAGLLGLVGKTRKLIILDLDNTIWGGVIGDDGINGIRMGGHDPSGEAFVDFQRALKALTNRGIILGIASKNEEAVALEAIDQHPEMILRSGDFAGWKINWRDKAQNILDLVSELNIGLDAVVFIDDNPVERARVHEALPEVFVPDWPPNEMQYVQALSNLACFDTATISADDSQRTKMYVLEKKRNQLRGEIDSLEEWLKSLDINLRIEELADPDITRTTQLLNKTNQMNLTTRRMSEVELQDWATQENHKLWTIRVSDRFGDSGLSGIVSLEIDGDQAKIVDFVLSCRVMGRKIEESMLAVTTEYALNQQLDRVQARYLPTEKNKPCLHFWQESGFDYDPDSNCFSWRLEKAYPFPEQVHVEHA
jgi:FkbH-like protein